MKCFIVFEMVKMVFLVLYLLLVIGLLFLNRENIRFLLFIVSDFDSKEKCFRLSKNIRLRL